MTKVTERIRNGVDTQQLFGTLDLLGQQPELGTFQFRARNEWLGGADLAIGRLEVLGYAFDGASGRLRPGNRAWEVDVAASAASGHLSVPFTFPGEVPMVLDMDRLAFGDPVRTDPDAPQPDPRQLPAIRVDIRDFAFSGYRFGHTRAEFARGTAGMTLNEFTMEHPAFTAKGHGGWLIGDHGAECRLDPEPVDRGHDDNRAAAERPHSSGAWDASGSSVGCRNQIGRAHV